MEFKELETQKKQEALEPCKTQAQVGKMGRCKNAAGDGVVIGQ